VNKTILEVLLDHAHTVHSGLGEEIYHRWSDDELELELSEPVFFWIENTQLIATWYSSGTLLMRRDMADPEFSLELFYADLLKTLNEKNDGRNHYK
jgi:hypothetical protein